MNIVPIPIREPVPAVVAMLENLLAMAKAGEVVSCAAVLVTPDGCTGNNYTIGSPILLIGELRILERELIDAAVDTTHHVAGGQY